MIESVESMNEVNQGGWLELLAFCADHSMQPHWRVGEKGLNSLVEMLGKGPGS
jgi:hypothetical protein